MARWFKGSVTMLKDCHFEEGGEVGGEGRKEGRSRKQEETGNECEKLGNV